MSDYFSKNYSNLRYPIDSEESPGLRNAQIGAIHAIASYFTISQKKAAITVMPTGSGKTTVLMMAPYVLSKNKVLIITPSIMVRSQIADDYKNLSTLRYANVFKDSMKKPSVYELEHSYDESMNADLENSDVIVATPQCALTLSNSDWAKANISLVEVDEAHHSPAKTWQQILFNLNSASQILFTATPFRLDKKEIIGDIVYNYPLSKAYSDGIFGEIRYIPVEESTANDLEIAKKAEEIFCNDRANNLQHYLMVRTDTKENAKTLEQLYSENTSLKLKRIDSSMKASSIKKCIEQLKEGELDGIICVDMLGEGFDFPNLKIAAIHKPHKSLASTLQFIGRFARTNANNIGEAKFIAVNNESLEIENNRLYAADAIWQDMIINMSEEKNTKEENEKKYYSSYEGSVDDNEDVSLNSISVNCHDKIYRVKDFNINASFPDALNTYTRVYRNTDDNTVVGIGMNHVSPLWLTKDNKIDLQHTLFIVHFQSELNLLHIYSQIHTEVIYEAIVKSFSTNYEKISKSIMNRVLGNLSDFEFFNSGMINRYNESGEAYRIMAGSDVSNAIDPTTGRIYSAGHVFCKAKDTANGDSKDITIGYSSASKVWSSRYVSLSEYIKWVDEIGRKITNSSIKVKTNTNYDYIPSSEILTKYPDNIFFGDYNYKTYNTAPIVIVKDDNYSCPITDFTIEIANRTDFNITFRLVNDLISEVFTCDIHGHYFSRSNKLHIKTSKAIIDLPDYFTDNPIIFKTFDDALISGDEIYKSIDTNNQNKIFDPNRIIAIDWDKYNTNIKKEFYKSDEKRGKMNSIQESLETFLLEDPNNIFVIFDHGSGEIADYISLQENDSEIIVKIYHVKKMSGATYNANVSDVYEVAGQAVKSIIWLLSKASLITKMEKRRSSGKCVFKKGTFTDFKEKLRGSQKQFSCFVVIVQPALSRSKPMDNHIQEILASANSYISKAGKVKGMEIIGSK